MVGGTGVLRLARLRIGCTRPFFTRFKELLHAHNIGAGQVLCLTGEGQEAKAKNFNKMTCGDAVEPYVSIHRPLRAPALPLGCDKHQYYLFFEPAHN